MHTKAKQKAVKFFWRTVQLSCLGWSFSFGLRRLKVETLPSALCTQTAAPCVSVAEAGGWLQALSFPRLGTAPTKESCLKLLLYSLGEFDRGYGLEIVLSARRVSTVSIKSAEQDNIRPPLAQGISVFLLLYL
jgi:hypothetical protein